MTKISDDKSMKKAKEKLKREAKKKISMHLSFIQKIEGFFYEPPLLKVPLVLILIFILNVLLSALSESTSFIFYSIRSFLLLFLSAYLVFFIVHLIKRSLNHLLKAKNIWTLFIAYAMFIFSIILLFSSFYDTAEKMDLGYLKYGQCEDVYTPGMENIDPDTSHSYFYFSSVTIFTVGYGDICPMGSAKVIAVINSFVGNFITVVLMVLVISNFMKRKEKS